MAPVINADDFGFDESVNKAIAEAFGEDVLHAAELSHLKSALNLLAAAKEQGNGPFADAMKRRIDERIKPLLRTSDVPRSEKCKLLLRRAAPILSLRAFQRFGPHD